MSTIDTIRSKLVCEFCKKQFNIPKLLPCGESICGRCLDEMCGVDNSVKSIKCPFCKDIHKVPTNGFPVQKLIQSLLTTDDGKESVNEILEKTENLVNDLNNEMSSSDSKIRAQCEFIKDEIEISVESIVNDLHKLKDQLFEEIDIYEQKCLSNIEHESESKKNFIEYSQKCVKRLNELKDAMKNDSLSSEQLSEIPKEMINMQNKLKNLRNNFEKYFYNDQVIQFRERSDPIPSAILGKLVYRNYVTPDEKYLLSIERLRTVNEITSTTCTQLVNGLHVHLCQAASLCDSQIVLYTYEVQQGTFHVILRIFDRNGNLIKENVGSPHSHLVSMSAYDKSIVTITRNNLAQTHLSLYDLNLTLLASTRLNFTPISVTLNETDIHVLSVEPPSFHLFNRDLQRLPPRLHNDENIVFLPLNANIYARNDKIIVRDAAGSRIRIFSTQTGRVEKLLNLNTANRYVDFDSELKIVLVEPDTKKLKILDDDGNLLHEQSINNIKPSSVCISENGCVVIYDNTNKTLHTI